MMRRSFGLVKSRGQKRYDGLETRIPLVKKTRLKVSKVAKKAIRREDGTLRLISPKQ